RDFQIELQRKWLRRSSRINKISSQIFANLRGRLSGMFEPVLLRLVPRGRSDLYAARGQLPVQSLLGEAVKHFAVVLKLVHQQHSALFQRLELGEVRVIVTRRTAGRRRCAQDHPLHVGAVGLKKSEWIVEPRLPIGEPPDESASNGP